MSGIEVELRFKVLGVPAIIEKLRAQGINQVKREHLIDQWFAPHAVKNHDIAEDWFNAQRGVAWRIRRTEQPDGSFAVDLSSKQLTEHNNHDTFAEHTSPITNYQKALVKMHSIGYRNWLTLDKTRLTFDAGRPEMEIVLDTVEGLAEKIGVGAALEIEYKGNATRSQALKLLNDFAATLGLNQSDRFARSLTVESMTALADYGE